MSHLAGRATTIGIVEAARTHVPDLRAPGADIVIALCHAGICARSGRPRRRERGARAGAVGGIDAIFVGHQHLLLPGADFAGIDGVDAERGALAAFRPSCRASGAAIIGVIDLTLEPEAAVGWRVDGRDGRSIGARGRAGERAADAGAARRDRKPRTRRRSPMSARPSARSQRTARLPISRWSATIPPCASSTTRNSGTPGNLADEHARRSVEAPLLSASAPFKCGGRGGPDYYTDVAGGPGRAAQRRRSLRLSERPARGEGDRRDAAGMAGALGERVSPARPEVDRAAAAARTRISQPTISTSIAGVTYRIDLDAARALRRPGPGRRARRASRGRSQFRGSRRST